MFIFVSCSDIFSGREETGSVTFSLSPELIQAVSNACRAIEGDAASSDEGTLIEQENDVPPEQFENKNEGKYKFEISIEGRAYKAYDFKSADDVTELKGKIFRFDNIPVGEKIYAEAKISAAEENIQWPIMKGKSEEKVIEAGENTLSFNLHKLAKCSVYNTTETGESLGEIERISVYAFPSSSEKAKEISELLVADTELNDLKIKSKLDSSKDNLVGDYYKDGNSNLPQDFQDGYELKDGEYIFLSLVYIKKGSVYLGWATELTTEISLEKVNTINLALSEMNLKVENVELRFRFWDEEKKEYVALESFPDKVLTNNDDYDEEFDELAKNAAVELGYTINEDKSDELKYDEESDKYYITVYFDKLPKNLMLALPGIAAEAQKFPGLFTLNIYTDFSYEVSYVMPQADGATSGFAEPLIVSKGRYTFDFDGNAEDKNADDNKTDRELITIKELEYYDFKSEPLVKAEKPVEAKVDLTQSFEFTGASGVVISFSVGGQGIVPFSISLKPTSGAEVPEISKVHSVTLYAVDATNANKLQTALASKDSSKAAADIINILEKHEETMAKEVSYLQNYDFTIEDEYDVVTVKNGTINIQDSFPSWGAIGKGKSLAIVAVVNYGDGKDIDAFCIGCSSVIEASAESNVVAFDYNPISVPCTISFCLGDDFAEEYTISTALSSFTPTKDETFLETVMAVAADTVEALKKKEYIYNRYVSGLSSGIPYVILYFVKDESKPTVKEMVLSDAPETIYVGESKSFGAKYVYSDGSEKAAESFRLETATGKTSDLVEVSDVKDGKITITGKTPGKVTFTVLSDEYEEIAATFTVTVEATSTSSGIEVNPAEIDTRDLADDFIVTSETGSDGSITLKAEPKTVENGYSYQWYVDGNAVNGATTMSYKWDPEMLRNLGSGVHYVMLQIEFTKGNEKEHYSVTKDSDGNKLILIVTSEE